MALRWFLSRITRTRASLTLTLTQTISIFSPSSPLQNPIPNPNPNPNPNPILASHFSTSFLVTKTPKKLKKKRKKKESPRTKLVQSDPNRIPSLERILHRDDSFRFLLRSKQFLSKQPDRILRLDDAGKLHRELGFPRGRKLSRFLQQHPLIFETYRHSDGKMWLSFTDFMEELLEDERAIMDEMEADRVTTVRKLLMMSAGKRIPLSKIHHCRSLFGIPDDFRDRVAKFPDWFRVVVDGDGRRVLELVNWDRNLAVSAIEREFMVDEDKAKRAFKFWVKYGKDLDLDEDEARKLNLLNTLPLVSPYSDGSRFDLWSLEAEKYSVGVFARVLELDVGEESFYTPHCGVQGGV